MNQERKKVYIIVGPTASGKSDVAIRLAKAVNGEIVSADSMQIYREMDIGTAKPDARQLGEVPHHLIDIVWPDEEFSVARFKEAAIQAITAIHEKGKVPVVVGGTGLYINALTYDLDFTQTVKDEAYRQELEKFRAEVLHDMLAKEDEQAAERIHPNDKKRLIRRLEIIRCRAGDNEEYSFRRESNAYDFFMAGLTGERQKLYERINSRVQRMFEAGLAAEARAVYDKYGGKVNALQAIGYKEFLPYFEGGADLQDVKQAIMQNTRRYAKRQLTWFARDGRIRWYDIFKQNNADALVKRIIQDGGKEIE